MIALLQGVVYEVQLETKCLVLLVGGVGYQLHVPNSVLQQARVDSPLTVFTYHHVREDSEDLFGFVDRSELQLFEQLMTVSGVGPKVGLTIVSHYPVATLAGAIQSGDTHLLMEVSGVGRKLAERLVLELKESAVLAQLPGISGGTNTTSEAVAALQSLGYSSREAAEALKNIDQALPIEQQIKLALQQLGRR